MRPVPSALLALLVLLTSLSLQPPAAQAKEFDIVGTVDCGKESGRLCIPLRKMLGVITKSISGNKERVEVDLTWVLQSREKKRDRGEELLTADPAVTRSMAFTELRKIMQQLSEINLPKGIPDSQDLENLVSNVFATDLPPEVVATRKNLHLITSVLKQDAYVHLTVRNDVGPELMVVTFVEQYKFQTDVAEGGLNTGSLTNSDPDESLCADFIVETLNWAVERIEKEGKLELTNLEERFFNILDDLPNPCAGHTQQIEATLDDFVQRLVSGNINKLKPKLRRFIQNKDLREEFREWLRETILKKAEDRARNRFRDLENKLERLPFELQPFDRVP